MRTIFGLAIAAGALAGAAQAADLPTHKAPILPPPAPAAFSWTGAYVGGFVGGNWNTLSPTNLVTGAADPKLSSNGLAVGLLGGYNWQYAQVVLGGELEVGYDSRGASAGFTDNNPGFPVPGGAFTATDSGSFQGRARARLGYAFDRFLVFLAAGYSAADLQLTYTNAAGAAQSLSAMRNGYNVGVGLDWAYDDHWIVRGEYIYDGYSARGYGFNAPGGLLAPRSAKMQESTVRAAVMYKF